MLAFANGDFLHDNLTQLTQYTTCCYREMFVYN